MNDCGSKRAGAMDLLDLRYLSIVVETGSFSSAAQSLGVNPATISRRIIPLGQKTEPADTASRRLLMIIAQKPTQSLAAPHWPLALPIVFSRKRQDVTLPLMIPLGMEMVDIVAQRPPQRSLAEGTLDKHSSLTDLTQRSV